MTSARHLLLAGISALAMSAGVGYAQQPEKVLLPWQKPQPRAHAPNMTEILPWLAADRDDKAPSPTPWKTEVDEPASPREPQVTEPVQSPASRIETGTIAPSGLVLKKPLPIVPVKNEGDASGIKGSIPLPGDKPVAKSAAKEVPANAAANARPAPADVAGDVSAPPARPVDAEEHSVVAPGETVKPATPSGDAISTTKPAHAEVPATGADTIDHTLRPTHAAGDAAAVVDAATSAVSPTIKKHSKQTAQAVPPEAAEGIPPLPQEDEAQPIPDPLPEATVTPVASPVAQTLPVQKAKELPQAIEAPRETAAPVKAPAPAATAAPAAAAASPSVAAEAKPTDTAVPQSKPAAPEKLGDRASVAQQYCFNIVDAAKDARYAWQKKTLEEIEQELQKRIALLDERTAEYQKWLARRDEFIRNAEENVVKIYAGMKPDAASIQLALMNEESAAAVLSKLSTRNASAILNEMEPGKAAKLTMIITGAAKLKRKKELKQQNEQPPAVRSDAGAAVPQEGRS